MPIQRLITCEVGQSPLAPYKTLTSTRKAVDKSHLSMSLSFQSIMSIREIEELKEVTFRIQASFTNRRQRSTLLYSFFAYYRGASLFLNPKNMPSFDKQ